VHLLRLQAPRAAYAHKSPGQQQSIKAGALRTLYGALAPALQVPRHGRYYWYRRHTPQELGHADCTGSKRGWEARR
jgi:hypothetical protein